MNRRWLVIASLAASAALVPLYLALGLPWLHAVAAALIVVLPCTLLGWGVWRVLDGPSLGHLRPGALRAATHAALAVGFSAVWTGAIAGLSYLVDRAAAAAFLENGAAWQFIGGLIVYAAIAASARASAARRRLEERELAAANAELQALRARLDPHFLFNTLHSLTQLTREDPRAAAEALERFGGLMRYVLRAGDDAVREVALEEELGFVRQYLDLERLRLGERLNVDERVDPETWELAVPPLLLQPLVENAVRHGIAPRRSGGTISIGARLEGERLQLSVSDDGDGADPDAWRASAGLGLAAVRRLLESHFPGEGVLRVQTRPGAGFAVHLETPARLPGAAP